MAAFYVANFDSSSASHHIVMLCFYSVMFSRAGEKFIAKKTDKNKKKKLKRVEEKILGWGNS